MKKAFFVSDAHFDRKIKHAENREVAFLRFLKKIESEASHLFIMGDLFEFWFEYKYLVPKGHVKLLYQFQKMIESGIAVHYIAGNHDFGLGQFFSDEIGFKVHWEPEVMDVQGKRIYLAHGDGLYKWDIGYKILKVILRNRLNQFLYRLLPADFSIGFARWCSHVSRQYTDKRPKEEFIRKTYRDIAANILKDEPDIVVLGHTHFADKMETPDGVFINPGAWMYKYSYAVMTEGEVELAYYESEQ